VQKSSLATNSDVEHYLRPKRSVGPEISPITEEIDADLAKESANQDQPSLHAVVEAKEAMVTGTSLRHLSYIASGSTTSAGTHKIHTRAHTHTHKSKVSSCRIVVTPTQ